MSESKWYKKPEMLIAFSALLVSLVTAVISVYSASIDRAYARAAIWPRLELHYSYYKDNFSYVVTNSGNGPALVQYAIVKYQSKPIKQWSDLPEIPGVTIEAMGKRILSSQQRIKPLSYVGESPEKMYELASEMSIELCYCSIYDECWLLNENNETVPINRCAVDSEVRFLQ